MTELLAPAGDFECAKTALYNGCDAIYCASERFGARAYAKNLSLDELKELLILAHSLNKKIYVTVNTIVKDSELEDCKEYVRTLYKMGVDGLILADFALINYVIDNLPYMEAHISTQCGVKDLEDVKFFEDLGAKRVVLARENSYEEIKHIKENSPMPLEIFAHGALCVSYSGGCLMSSMLTLRSGNRGRCSQNCRREYTLLKGDEILADKGFHLSMKDLNTSKNISKLVEIGIDSLKLEGRMKNPEYVKIITEEYRKSIDFKGYEPKALESIFHRAYSKGFIFGEDRGQIVDITKKNNEGDLIGEITKKEGKLTRCTLKKELHVGDRIRIEIQGSLDYYFTVDEIFDQNQKSTPLNNGTTYLNIFKELPTGSKIYKMIDSTIDLTIDNTYKRGIKIEAIGSVGSPLTLLTKIDGKTFEGKSTEVFQSAKSKPIDTDSLTKQLKKLNDTSFYLSEVINSLNGDLFMTIASINEARRNLVEAISKFMEHARAEVEIREAINPIDYEVEATSLTAFCTNEDQYRALKECGIETIYYKNYSPYVEAHYDDVNEDTVLVGNYGGLHAYKGKTLVTDYSFNAINAKAVYDLHRAGAKYVTLSLEASLDDMRALYQSYKPYGNNPNLEITVYGRQNLMTTKYCPLRRYGQCGKCNSSQYYIKDEKASFPLYHVGCITHIVNEKPLNLIDDLREIQKYSNRLRLQFTIESYEETKRIAQNFLDHLAGDKTQSFDSKKDTRGYYKREIL